MRLTITSSPPITKEPWRYHFTSAREARLEADDGTDGGGGSGTIQTNRGNSLRDKTIAFLPHHRDEKEDAEREANAKAMSAMNECLYALELVIAASSYDPLSSEAVYFAKKALEKSGYVIRED